jgi:peptide/nickel transport system ATP-binding protein
MNAWPLLSVRDLGLEFKGERATRALNDVSFDLAAGEVLGLIGESGSGKSVLLRSLLRLHAPSTCVTSGRVLLDGRDVAGLRGRALRHYRGGIASMVFQEPGLAFDPVCTIGSQIEETIRAHEALDARAARQRALQMLERVQIPQARRRLDAYPHELSGGLKQRAMIALALACRPRLLLADEPTTALDATVQIQILLLLRELQRETGMAVIFVTHDIGAAVELCDRIAVMYAGRIVEDAAVDALVSQPRHPYTDGLLAARVEGQPRGQPLRALPGAPPDLAALAPGCAFAPRCPQAGVDCLADVPRLIPQHGRAVACLHPL